MLNSLYIKNYRNLKELQIDSVAQVNLLCGKNNTGKTSILEALGIYASGGQISFLDFLLNNRQEFFESADEYIQLFSDNLLDFSNNNSIIVGEKRENPEVNISFNRYCDIQSKDENGEKRWIHKLLTDKELSEYPNHYIGIKPAAKIPSTIFRFISANGTNVTSNDIEFDRISLSDKKKKSVIDALKIIESKINNLSYISDKQNEERKPKVTFEDNSKIMLLTRMGDGINRILTIILAAVNCENGYLLIDEFENGLHYTVQEQLWKIIFKLAKDLNIQVFATTHSNDCIHSFSKVLNAENNEVLGKLIRLDN
ncbi:MAG: AAA family ATPase, partial [Paludibacter sp.]|nr:AAA family ATPase [Paludibacter sp.]